MRLAAVADQQLRDLTLTRECVTSTRALLETTRSRLRRGHSNSELSGCLERGPAAPWKLPGPVGLSLSAQEDAGSAVIWARRRELSAQTRDILASAYEVSGAAVAADAEALSNWASPFDELIAQICHSHTWAAEMGAIYLGALRSALLGREPTSPWLD